MMQPVDGFCNGGSLVRVVQRCFVPLFTWSERIDKADGIIAWPPKASGRTTWSPRGSHKLSIIVLLIREAGNAQRHAMLRKQCDLGDAQNIKKSFQETGLLIVVGVPLGPQRNVTVSEGLHTQNSTLMLPTFVKNVSKITNKQKKDPCVNTERNDNSIPEHPARV